MSLSLRDNPPADVTPQQSTFPLGPTKPEVSPSAPSPPPVDASPSQLDEVLERFDQVWHAGQSPAIDDYLPPSGHPLRLHVLEELVRMDLECRIKAGQPVRIEEYLARHPELGQDDELLLGLLVRECEAAPPAGPGTAGRGVRPPLPPPGGGIAATA